MKKIGIITEKFVLWSGGLDFVKNLIFSLESVAKENDFEIFIFIEKPKNYRNYKGLKRVIEKLKDVYSADKEVKFSNEKFKEFENFKFISYNRHTLKKMLKEFKIDFFFPHMAPEYFKIPTKQIGYVYDCQHKYYPEFFDKRELKVRSSFFSKMLKGKVIVNAKAVKEDLKKFYNAKDENIIVLPCLPKVKEEYFENHSQDIEKYNLPEKYFIISNQFWVHKDHKTAFKAFAKVVQEYPDVQLICTGLMEEPRIEGYIDSLINLINELGCNDKIRLLGLIPKKEQIEIMKNSTCVIQPTLFEGGAGGGSAQDAVALGVPVIMSDIDINKEIEGYENVFYFKAQDENDLCEKMKNILKTEIRRTDEKILAEKNSNNLKRLGSFLAQIIEKELNS